jgi:hypothetical protein
VIVKYRGKDDPDLQGTVDDTYQGGLSEVLTDKDFSNMFEKKQNAKDFNWKTVEYVQSCVKD